MRLRARCPVCRTLTAVAVGPDYECHSCGREFGAGLVRVPRAWGTGGEAMAQAASPALDPGGGRRRGGLPRDQNLAIAAGPARPAARARRCCCSHVGALEALAARHDRLALVWLDAHGDLNTPATSPSGNDWGMPLRMIIDAGWSSRASRSSARATSTRRRRSSSPRAASTPAPDAVDLALADCGCVYVALDLDASIPPRSRR